MNLKTLAILVATLGVSAPVVDAQTAGDQTETAFAASAESVQQKLEASLAELTALRDSLAQEKLPLARQLSELERELLDAREKYQQTSRLLDSRTLDLTNLQNEIRSRGQEMSYLSNLLSEYARNFESSLHIAEIQRYRDQVQSAMLAPENSNLSPGEVYQTQGALVSTSIDRLSELLGGTRFDGSAVSEGGLVKDGSFVVLGPVAVFRSHDGEVVGAVEQRVGSTEPTVIPYLAPEDASAAAQLITGAGELVPLDLTLGRAHQMAQTKETIWEHIQKGGPVMVPIFVLAGAALLVALYKWVALVFRRTPSKKQIASLLAAVDRGDMNAASDQAQSMKGALGRMLAVGMAHVDEPRELIEEVMYEQVMATRLKLQRMLPFIAVTAASAPLLGLLGTVTGIINTFQLITIFGTGDVQTLSGGISEALITTEFGLIVAIPSLLLSAFLSRKARRVTDQMEQTAIVFLNHLSRAKRKDATDEPQASDRQPITAASSPKKATPGPLHAGDTASSAAAPLGTRSASGVAELDPPASSPSKDSAVPAPSDDAGSQGDHESGGTDGQPSRQR